jgi:hypothetical protein
MTTTLEEKFEALELQLTDQHTTIANDLTAILEALGAPPPGPTTTLADIATQLAGIGDQLTTIQSDNSTFYAALLETAGLISTNLETLSNNNSLNAQRLLKAIYATFCGCATDAPLLTPPLDVTPTDLVAEAKCRRIQFYLSLFGTWLFDIANYGSSGAAVTGDVLFSLLSAAGTAVGLATTGAEAGTIFGIPGAVVGAVVGLIVGAVYLFGGSQLVNYANDFNDPTLRDNMVQAMFAATNADEGYTAFKTTLLAGMDTIPAEIIYTLWWSAWSNDIYSGTPEVDDSAFDGTICVEGLADITTCQDFDAVLESADGANWYAILVPEQYTGTGADDFTIAGDFIGWTVELLYAGAGRSIRARYISTTFTNEAEFLLAGTGDTNTFIHHTVAIEIYTNDHDAGAEPFGVRICPPA